MADIDTSKHEFQVLFHCGKDVTFQVSYYRHSDSKTPVFDAEANIHYPNHKGILRGPAIGTGECNKEALALNCGFIDSDESVKFIRFWSKWEKHQHSKLTSRLRSELESDLKELKQTGAPYMESRDGDHELFLRRHSVNFVQTKPHTAYRIMWDTDGASLAECNLPRGSVILPFGMTSGEDISDWLSEKFGYCHDGFLTNFNTDEECDDDPPKIQTEVHIEKVLYIIHPKFGDKHKIPYGVFLVSDGLDTKKCRTKGDMVGDKGPQYITFKRKRYKVTITGRAGNELISLKPMV